MTRKKKKKQIKRPRKTIEGGGQLSLLVALNDSGDEPADTQYVDKIGRPVVLKDPDPRTIIIGNLRLDEFLDKMDCKYVMTTRSFLRSLSWDAFIASYQGGGMQPYHPALYLGLILFGIMQSKTSLRQLELLARTDVRAW